ncbi:MAG: NAD(P)/FAD-dependent oxidoreductase [Acidobacteriaceae bacterium]|nr:NAD(P)/FAD-dependent oxidoreductase [Acidobacteriaceae bacterium]
MMVSDVDVLIAGGGPAGLAAAESAARKGASVAVFEKNSEIGSPTRTSGGSFIRDLEELGIPQHLYHPVRVCHFISPKRRARFEYHEPLACGLDVRRTYQFLAQRAIVAGAVIFPATSVLDLVLEQGQVVGARIKTFRGKELCVTSRVLIDATGYRAGLLKQAGVMKGHERFGVGAEYDLYAPNYNQDEIVLIVGSVVAPSGYAWALPYGEHRVRVGVGVIHADSDANPQDYLERLVENAGQFGMDLRGAQPVEFHTGLIPSDGMPERFTGNGIIGAGDAAGQPSTLLGEGIRWAMWAGSMAGEVAGEAVAARDFSAGFLKRYEKRWRSKHGTNLRIAAEINRRIARWSDDRWDEGTETLSRLTPWQFNQALRTELVGIWAFQAGARELWKRVGL